MGLDQRDYMQADGPPLHLGTTGRPWWRDGWAQLLGLNLALYFVWVLAQPQWLFQEATFSVAEFQAGHLWTPLTSAFFHTEFWHLLWNILFLYVFSRELEPLYGKRNLWALYLFGACVAALFQGAANQWQGHPDSQMLGASGAVMALGVVTALFFPNKRFYVWGVMPVPLWVLTLCFLALDLIGVMGEVSGRADGVAHAAHLGGAISGALFQLFDLRPFRSRDSLLGPGLWQRLWRRQRWKVTPGPDNRLLPPPQRGSQRDLALESRVDDILRKISREGMDSLSEDERALLQRASESFRR